MERWFRESIPRPYSWRSSRERCCGRDAHGVAGMSFVGHRDLRAHPEARDAPALRAKAIERSAVVEFPGFSGDR